jgi:ubiquinone/menaquinone biosynthesis C-methylase UbiE
MPEALMQDNDKLSQARQPSGTTGRVFGWLMTSLNEKSYRWAIEQLKPIAPESYLEIGFGTGRQIELAVRMLRVKRACGVDPSPLMLETAEKKLKRYRKKAEIELKLGDDRALPWSGPFDAIAATHSFQFWSDPDATLTRLHGMLAPNGRLLFSLRRHSGLARRNVPNPLSRKKDEISAACAAFEKTGFVIAGIQAISKSSHGIVLRCG